MHLYLNVVFFKLLYSISLIVGFALIVICSPFWEEDGFDYFFSPFYGLLFVNQSSILFLEAGERLAFFFFFFCMDHLFQWWVVKKIYLILAYNLYLIVLMWSHMIRTTDDSCSYLFEH